MKKQLVSSHDEFAIPHDIISFKDGDRTICEQPFGVDRQKPGEYEYWCYWCLRNGYPVHSIKFKDKIYTVGTIINGKTIVRITWRGNYWRLTFEETNDWLM